jgi:hypothetical protein
MDVQWIGWAVDRPGRPLFVEYGVDEAKAREIALGWPTPEEIEFAKAQGARAFQVVIKEYHAKNKG